MEDLLGRRRSKKTKGMAPVRIIVLSFLGIILIGGFLLWLPFSSRTGAFTPIENAMFTATSATCVTGLNVYDTWQHWSPIGQVILLLLIQVGGLGLVTFTTGFTLLFRQKLGIKDLALAKENSGTDNVDIKHLLKTVFLFTFSVEFIGTALLLIRFVPMCGIYGVWVSVFTAISSFCNAGFDIFTSIGLNASAVSSDPLVSLTMTGLIVVGGLGFIVVSDIYLKKLNPLLHRKSRKRLSFQSQVVLISTLFLLVVGAAAIMTIEYRHALKDYNFFQKMLVSLFQSASSRTAGFSAIDPATEHSVTKFIDICLMFIGGSPGATAGGIKTTTIAVLVATIFSVFRGRTEVSFLKRRIDTTTVFEALTLFAGGMVLSLATTIVILISIPDVSAIDALYESVSGFSTTGFNAAFTPHLLLAPKIALIINMFVGRVGVVSLGLAFANRKPRHSESILPDGKLMVG